MRDADGGEGIYISVGGGGGGESAGLTRVQWNDTSVVGTG